MIFSTAGTVGIYACGDIRLRGRRSKKHATLVVWGSRCQNGIIFLYLILDVVIVGLY